MLFIKIADDSFELRTCLVVHGSFRKLAGKVLAESGSKSGAEQCIAGAAIRFVFQHGEVGHEGG